MKTFFLVLVTFFSSFLLTSLMQRENAYIFKDEDRTVRIEIEDNLSFLEVNKETKFKVFVENINLEKSSIFGIGIRMLGSNNLDSFTCSVTVTEKNLTDGKYKIQFNYRLPKDGKLKNHIFYIPVKR